MDGSDCTFTCCLYNPIIVRYLVRSAYNIPGSTCEDCLMGTFCSCCVVNQIYQTTKAYGAANPESGGARFNTGRFGEIGSNKTPCCDCLYAFFCMPCAVGTVIERSVGLPCIFGFCCGSLCWARNITRYQYRIAGNDCMDDCFWLSLLVYMPILCAPIYSPCYFVACGFIVGSIMQILGESETRNHAAGITIGAQYLSNAALPRPAASPSAPPVTAATIQPGPGGVIYAMPQGGSPPPIVYITNNPSAVPPAAVVYGTPGSNIEMQKY
jgi:hypothetical protein